MIVAPFNSDSRLMMFASHPDDESLAGSIILQRAVRRGTAIRIVYATDGDNNPWPQRLLGRKWRLDAADRKRWGKLRRAEALNALAVLGLQSSSAQFLALPDQKLTCLLTRDCNRIIERLAAIIADWAPTQVLVPSVADTHPDHNAFAVMLRLVWANLLSDERRMPMWSYVVHGESRAFFNRAQNFPQSESEKAIKLQAIQCHKTQLKLSRSRFLKYAVRPECLLKLDAQEATIPDGSIQSISRQSPALHLKLELSVRAIRATEPTLFVLGHTETGALCCANIRLPTYSSRLEMSDCASGRSLGSAQYCGNAFAGELTVPIDTFSTAHALFVKLERRSWFFDEAGWLEIPPAVRLGPVVATTRNVLERLLPATC
jgi:LmbE family N-acetylglucosaminyl deacetylase